MTETLAQQWLAAMLGVSIQFTVLAAVVAAALYVLRSLPPSARYVVWLLVLARLAIPVGLTSPWGAVPSSLTPSRIAEAPAGGHVPAVARVETAAYEAPASPAVAGPATRPGAGPGPSVSPAVVLFLAWGLGVLGLATVQVVRSVRRRARLRAAMEPLPPEIGRRIEELRAELGLRRPVDVRVVGDIAIGGPLVQGCVKPRILLPASLVRSWSRKELDAVLLHELVHLRRLDPAARALGNLLQIAYFFHPVVWWVRQRLAEEREQACDDAVVRRLRGYKRIYMKGLLRLVEERAGGWHGMHPELRMAAGRRPLARRLKRMLQPRYSPSRRVGALTVSALVLSVGLGCALSTGAPVRPAAQEAQVEEMPEIYTRVSVRRVFRAESVDRIEEADRVTEGAVLNTAWRAVTPLKPDAAALAARNPALFERLEALGGLGATFLVDRTGAVHRVRFTRDVDEDLRRPFLEVLEAARFDPSPHFGHEPVVFELQVEYFVNPALPRPPYERGQPLVEDEVAEASPFGGQADLPRGGLPRYAAVLEKGEPPVLDVGDEEWILSFILSVDSRGNVVRATPFQDSRDGPFQVGSAPSPESEALAAYLQTFRLEPFASRELTPSGTMLFIDLRVSSRGVEVATRAGDREELERRLAETYRLPEGRNLDLRPPPHPPERMVLYRTGNPVTARMNPLRPDMLMIVWTGDRPAYGGASFGPAGVLSLMSTLGIRRGAVRFAEGTENVRVAADIVMRDGASEEELIADLPRALKERLDLDLGFRVVSEPATTLVLRGSVGTVPQSELYDFERVLHVFTDRRNEDPRGGGGGPTADAAGLADMLSYHLDMPVVNATTGAVARPFHVQVHDSAYETRQLDLLIENLEAQTDLDIAVEDRPERIVVVSPS